jgi:hypothetical protein
MQEDTNAGGHQCRRTPMQEDDGRKFLAVAEWTLLLGKGYTRVEIQRESEQEAGM